MTTTSSFTSAPPSPLSCLYFPCAPWAHEARAEAPVLAIQVRTHPKPISSRLRLRRNSQTSTYAYITMPLPPTLHFLNARATVCSVRWLMHRLLERLGESSFDRIFNQRLGALLLLYSHWHSASASASAGAAAIAVAVAVVVVVVWLLLVCSCF